MTAVPALAPPDAPDPEPDKGWLERLLSPIADVRRGEAATALLDACDQLGSRLDEHDAVQPWSPLTLRELEVARLVSQGLTNREIAEQLRITVRTAGSHLEHISAKLGLGRRSEIATWVTSLDRVD